MQDPGGTKAGKISDLRHRIRRLQWFRQSFHEVADDIGRRFHFLYAIDDRLLVDAFFRWARQFELERGEAGRNRLDFAIYSAGLMLRELCSVNPARKTGAGQFENLIPPEPMAKICEFWPEGYLYTIYCRNLLQAILEQEFQVEAPDVPELRDMRVWESFRENVHENPLLAGPVLDVFMGVEPNWAFPEHFLSRPGAKAAALTASESA